MTNRYPFLVSGIVHCGQCGERLSGKSAHGEGGKIPYYEHCWSTIKKACLETKAFHCNHRRILAKRLEPLVWHEIEKLLSEPKAAEALLADARDIHAKRTRRTDFDLIQNRVYNLTSQIDALAERIAVLPKARSPEPFYKQMEKLQTKKAGEEEKLKALQNEIKSGDEPAEIASFHEFLTGLRRITV